MKNIKQKAISGIKWTSLSSGIIALVQIAQVSILARLLSPSDFGLMAIVMVVIGFSRIFSDMGISNAIIHKQNTSHRQLSSLYWLNIVSGLTLFLIISALSPLIALFYKEPKLTELLIILATSFIIIAIGNQYRVLFQKELRFNMMAKIEMTAAFGAFYVAVLSAIKDFGVYALVYASLTNAVISSGLFLFLGLREHKPSFVFKYNEIKEYVGFGMYQMGDSTLNYFNSEFDVILIGRLLGTEALGVYSIVKQLVMRPAQIINPIITRVTFPVMAKVQDDNEQLKKIYLKTINYLASVNFPIYITIAVLAEPIVMIMFGKTWQQGIPILQILSIYAMVRSTGNPIGSLVMAKGRVNLSFFWNLSLFIFIPLVIWFGSDFGLIGIASSLLLLQITLTIPGWYFMVRKLCRAGFLEYYKQILSPLFLSGISAVAGLIIYSLIGKLISNFIMEIEFNQVSNYFIHIVSFILISGTFYIILSKYLNHGFVSILKNLK